MSAFIYLASQSPRRRQLLDQLGVAHQLLLPGPEEDAEALEAVLDGEQPERYCERVTGAKLEAALQGSGSEGAGAVRVNIEQLERYLDLGGAIVASEQTLHPSYNIAPGTYPGG